MHYLISLLVSPAFAIEDTIAPSNPDPSGFLNYTSTIVSITNYILVVFFVACTVIFLVLRRSQSGFVKNYLPLILIIASIFIWLLPFIVACFFISTKMGLGPLGALSAGFGGHCIDAVGESTRWNFLHCELPHLFDTLIEYLFLAIPFFCVGLYMTARKRIISDPPDSSKRFKALWWLLLAFNVLLLRLDLRMGQSLFSNVARILAHNGSISYLLGLFWPTVFILVGGISCTLIFSALGIHAYFGRQYKHALLLNAFGALLNYPALMFFRFLPGFIVGSESILAFFSRMFLAVLGGGRENRWDFPNLLFSVLPILLIVAIVFYARRRRHPIESTPEPS